MLSSERPSRTERNELRKVLSEWGVPAGQIGEILRHAVFGPGAVGLEPEEMERGVGIMVDETRDPEIARLFEWRRQVGDEAFAAGWEFRPPRALAVLCPHAREALYAFTVEVIRPVQLTRTYLLLVSKHARVLPFLRERGSVVWLVPQAVALREWAKEGLGRTEDLISHALPVGQVERPGRGLEEALRHVGVGGR